MATIHSAARRRRVRQAIGTVVIGLLVAACASSSTGTELHARAHRAPIDRRTTAATVLANSQLAMDIYDSLAGASGNFVFSPFTVSVGLEQLALGAEGATALQLAGVQHQPPGLDLRSGLNTLSQQLAGRAGDRQNDVREGVITLDLPVVPWVQQDMDVLPSYLRSLDRWFGAGVRSVDFRSDPGAAHQAIDNWMAEQTDHQIDAVVTPGQITDATQLVTTAGAFIAAPWDQRFDVTRTRQTIFHRLDGSSESVTSIGLTAARGLEYASSRGWQAVMVPYLGRELAMVVLVPDPGQFHAVEHRLDGAELQSVLDALRPAALDLELPRFEILTRSNLGPVLRAHGLTTIFDPAHARLGGLAPDLLLTLDGFDEAAFVSADEEGMQAAAPTAVRAPVPPPSAPVVVRVDRPFIVAVVDRASGEPVLFGRVVDPIA
jgi:serpin B